MKHPFTLDNFDGPDYVCAHSSDGPALRDAISHWVTTAHENFSLQHFGETKTEMFTAFFKDLVSADENTQGTRKLTGYLIQMRLSTTIEGKMVEKFYAVMCPLSMDGDFKSLVSIGNPPPRFVQDTPSN